MTMLELRAACCRGLGQIPAAIDSLETAIQLLSTKPGAAPLLKRASEARIAGLRKTQATLRQAQPPSGEAPVGKPAPAKSAAKPEAAR